MKTSLKGLAAMLLIGALLFAAAAAQAAERPLNVIVVLVDDLGWMDLSCQGSDFYRTPNIDKLASGGMRFTDGYAACAVCSPTRAALMTGRYPARLGVTDWIRAEFQLNGRQWPNVRDAPGFHDGGKALITPVNNMLLPHSEITLAELVKPLGYRSAFIGKWHLGGKGHLPTDQGFDLELRRLGLRSAAILLRPLHAWSAAAARHPDVGSPQAGRIPD